MKRYYQRNAAVSRVTSLGGSVSFANSATDLQAMDEAREIFLNDTAVTDADLQLIASLNEAVSLVLDGTSVTDGGMEHVRQFRQLRLLSLQGTAVSDAGIAVLSSMGGLRSLDMRGVNSSKPGFNVLSTMHLEELWCTPSGILPADIAEALSNATSLRKLHLRCDSGCDCLPMDRDTFRALKKLPMLTVLDLSYNSLDSESWQEVFSMEVSKMDLSFTNLSMVGCCRPNAVIEELIMFGAPIGDLGLLGIEKMQGLNSMVLARTKITDHAMSSICKMRGLTRLDLTNTAVTDDSVERLCELHNLQDLYIRGTSITSQGIRRLRSCLQCRIHTDLRTKME